jgi:hypothetical protein
MPGFDGMGPQNQGPMTGRGEGYCAFKLPGPGEVPLGYAGLRGIPVRLGAGFARWLWPVQRVGRGRGRGPGRSRGRRSGRW